MKIKVTPAYGYAHGHAEKILVSIGASNIATAPDGTVSAEVTPQQLEGYLSSGVPRRGTQVAPSSGKATTMSGTSYKGYAIRATADGEYVIPKLDADSRFDSLSDAKRFLDSWKKNPELKKAVASTKKAGRGALKFYDQLSGTVWNFTGGVPRRIVGALVGAKNPRPERKGNPANPQDAAEEMYESFHGKPATTSTVVKEWLHQHKDLATLGVLVNFKVATLSGWDMFIGTPDAEAADRNYDESAADEKTTFLAANEAGTQLYFVGGDQSFPLDRCKMGESSAWYRDDMVIGILYEITYRTKKKFDKFQLTDYYHQLGEETGDQPMLRYDPLSPHLYVSGGKYKIKMPLIGMSPGIEN